MDKLGWNKGNTPPKSGKYLVYLSKTKDGDTWNSYPVEIADFQNGEWISIVNAGVGNYKKFITHWHEIPKLPST